MRCRPWTSAELTRAVMLLDDGLSKVDAAAVLGRSSGSLRKALSRNRAEAWARLRQKQRHRGV